MKRRIRSIRALVLAIAVGIASLPMVAVSAVAPKCEKACCQVQTSCGCHQAGAKSPDQKQAGGCSCIQSSDSTVPDSPAVVNVAPLALDVPFVVPAEPSWSMVGAETPDEVLHAGDASPPPGPAWPPDHGRAPPVTLA